MSAVAVRAGVPVRFLLAGAVNTLVGLSVYPLLLWSVPAFRTHYFAALLLAQALCLGFAFANYKFGVFRTRGNAAREFGAFSGFYLANYALNWAALPLLVEVAHIPPVIAQLGFAVVLVVGSWFWHTRVTFRSRGGMR